MPDEYPDGDPDPDSSVIDKLKDRLPMTDDQSADSTDTETETEPETEPDAGTDGDAGTLPARLPLDEAGYDKASVGEVKDAVEYGVAENGLTDADINALTAYERAHKDRVTLCRWLERAETTDTETADDAAASDDAAAVHAESERAVADEDDAVDGAGDTDAADEPDTRGERATDAAVEADPADADVDVNTGENAADVKTADADHDPNQPVRRDETATRAGDTQPSPQATPTAEGEDQTDVARKNATTREDTSQVDERQPHDPNATQPRGKQASDEAHADLQRQQGGERTRATERQSAAHAESERKTTTRPQTAPGETTVVTIESPRTGYIGGIWFDDPGTISVSWDPRIERAVREGVLDLLSARDESVIPDDIVVGQPQPAAENEPSAQTRARGRQRGGEVESRSRTQQQGDTRPRRQDRDQRPQGRGQGRGRGQNAERARGQDRAAEAREQGVQRREGRGGEDEGEPPAEDETDETGA